MCGHIRCIIRAPCCANLLWIDLDSPAGHPFLDVQSNFYWPSTTPVDAPNLALRLDVGNGNLGSNVKTADHFVWPVRGGLQLL
jgi:hypothetical protein